MPFVVLISLALLSGCWVYSAHPLAESEADLVFDRLLLGNWWQADEGCSISFSRLSDDRVYHVVYAAPPNAKACLLANGKSAAFEGRLVEIGGTRFLDLYPADRDAQHHEMLLHSFFRVHIDAATLALSPMDEDWIRGQINSRRLGLGARDLNEKPLAKITTGIAALAGGEDNSLVLTAPTRQLREFLRAYAASDELFNASHRLDFTRRPEPI